MPALPATTSSAAPQRATASTSAFTTTAKSVQRSVKEAKKFAAARRSLSFGGGE